jgi:hypothetical protein
MSCVNSRNDTMQLEDNNAQVTNLSIDQISNLEIDKIVNFYAILVKSVGKNCVELFTENEFKKYNGDGKWSITSKFNDNPRFANFSFGSKPVMVTGRMLLVNDSKDTTKTCGIVKGNIFEISDTTELKNE